MNGWNKFTSWFFTEILGVWFIWASYMAIRFISDDAQGIKASFGTHDSSGVAILAPCLLTAVFTFVSAIFWADRD
jgi:hypothetical protein